MAEIDSSLNLDTVKKRTVTGVLTLTGRNAVMQAVNFIGGVIILPLFLSPDEFGVFFLIMAVINFLVYFSDIGLAAALIQKKEKLKREDLVTTFTVQQILILPLSILVIIVSPLIQKMYGFSSEAIWLLWALVISFILSSWKTIPSVLLERQINFTKLVIPQIAEVVVFNLIAVFLAWRGFGITSFTFAVIARGVVGLVILYYLRPWKPGISLSVKSLKELLRFGLPYQANTILALIKDDGMTVFLGTILGVSGIGFLGWAQKWAFAPLRFFMDQVIKVTFPAYSRMQDNTEELSKAVGRSIFFICLVVFPSIVGLVTIAPLLTEIFPKYQKWQPALLALSLYSINAAWAAVTTPLTNLLNAIGKIKLTFYLMIMWTVLTWAIIPFLAIKYGINGAAAGSAIVGSSSFVAIAICRKYVNFSLIESVFKPLIAAFGMTIILFLVRGLMSPTLTWVFVLVIFGLLTYLFGIVLLLGPRVMNDVKKIISLRTE